MPLVIFTIGFNKKDKNGHLYNTRNTKETS